MLSLHFFDNFCHFSRIVKMKCANFWNILKIRLWKLIFWKPRHPIDFVLLYPINLLFLRKQFFFQNFYQLSRFFEIESKMFLTKLLGFLRSFWNPAVILTPEHQHAVFRFSWSKYISQNFVWIFRQFDQKHNFFFCIKFLTISERRRKLSEKFLLSISISRSLLSLHFVDSFCHLSRIVKMKCDQFWDILKIRLRKRIFWKPRHVSMWCYGTW